MRSPNACLYEQPIPHEREKKGWISEEENFYSIEQTVSTVVMMARVAVTVVGLVIVIF